MTVRLLKHLTARPGPAPKAAGDPPAESPAEPLTDRELDVVRLVAVGRTNAELYVSLSTGKTHLSSVQLKLPEPGRDRRLGLAERARLTGLRRL